MSQEKELLEILNHKNPQSFFSLEENISGFHFPCNLCRHREEDLSTAPCALEPCSFYSH